MSDLRIKVKFGDFEIELQGEKDTVREEFRELKEKGLENLLSNVNQLSINSRNSSSPNQHGIPPANKTDIGSYPSMKDVILKQLPQTEVEWVLIYAFYSSEYSTKYFTHSDVVAMYDTTSRKTNNRIANLSNNIKSLFKSEFLTAINDEEYLVTESGNQAVLQILSRPPGKGQSSPKSTKSKSNSPKEPKNSGSNNSALKSREFKLLTDLSLKPQGKTSMIDYVANYQASSNPEKILLIVSYFKDVLKTGKVSKDHIFTGLKEIKARVPDSLDDIISNVKGRNGWIKFDTKEDISVSVKGSEYIIHDMKKRNNK